MVFPAIKAPLLRRILMRIFAVLPGFFAVKKNVFLIRFLYFEGQIFAYFRAFIFLKQMVFPAIKAPLLRRILMRIFAVLPGFFAVKKNVFLIRFLYFEGQFFAYIRSFIFLQADGFPSN